VTINDEERKLFQVQSDLRHSDATVREAAGLELARMMFDVEHPVIHRRALALYADRCGCDVIQSESRDRITFVPRTSAVVPRVGLVAVQ
jgi:hypothetical protein